MASDQSTSEPRRAAVREVRYFLALVVKGILFFYLPLEIALIFLHFPSDTDPAPGAASPAGRRSARFYEAAYVAGRGPKRGLDYEATARKAAEGFGILEEVRRFASDYGLAGKKVLEVGSGRGYLQDVVADYTGLDLSPSVAGHYHKPFVAGSATKMPLADGVYDAVWSVWVLEHIPEPERALTEIRRVVKPDGLVFLRAAWNCTPWAADGFDVRPYSDFNWRGKLVKVSIPFRVRPGFQDSYLLPIRAIRWAHYAVFGKGTRLRFRALDPNYDVYWQPDSDAAVSLDRFETLLWFRSRGDECLNCGGLREEWRSRRDMPLILRIRKSAAGR